MKTRTEILLKYTPYLGSADITYKNILKAMSEVEQQTREEMSEFMKWMDMNTSVLTIYDSKECHKYGYQGKAWEPKELFDYWKSLNK